jgi:hypothetical protein
MGNSMSWNVAMIMISTAVLTIESPLSFTGTNYIQLPVIWMSITNYDWDTIFMPNYFCITMFNSLQSTPLSFASLTEQLTLLTVSFINFSLIVDTHEQSSWYFKTQASPDLKLRLIWRYKNRISLLYIHPRARHVELCPSGFFRTFVPFQKNSFAK